MPKHEFMTPKAIANRIKSKGLQKLRWYCQMCQKQCRDENGFKCHIMSESHQRQLLLVADNPGRFVGSFSEEFLKGFMDILRRQYGTRRVHCNVVYQEYIRDKDHYHMNATRWSTLTGFVMWLGRQGLCEVEPTPKGWYIKYIDRSPEAMERQAADAKKKKMDRDDEEITQLMIEDQIVRAMAAKKCKGDDDEEPQYTELKRKDENEKITLNLFGAKAGATASSQPMDTNDEAKIKNDKPEVDEIEKESNSDDEGRESKESNSDEEESEGSEDSESSESEEEVKPKAMKLEEPEDPPSLPEKDSIENQRSSVPVTPLGIPNALKLAELEAKKKKSLSRQQDRKRKTTSELDKIFKLEEERREKMNRRDYWLHVGIVIKVLNKRLGEKFYKKKGVIEELHDKYTATVRMLDGGDKIKIDQSYLETVIPAIGRDVLVVNGAYRGYKAKLEDVDVDNYSVSVTISQGPSRGRYVERIAYEDVSKISVQSFPFAR